jgi:tripartite-type tricarboxylate transporter receptor subunit TctC
MTIRGSALVLATLGAWALLLGGPAADASAQDQIAEFYRGKQIRIIAPSAPGGGFDLYARYVGRHLGKHIPGNPSVIVQNMPGAGGLAATNHVYTRASRDGLTLGVLQGPLTYAQVGKSRNVQFDMRKFGWLGSANVTSNTCVFSPRAGIKTGDDLLTKTVIIGASGGSTEFVPNLLNAMLGTNSASVNGRDYFARGIISVGLECANERHPDLAARGVPYMMDLAKSEESKKVLSFLFAYLVYIRPFVAPPEVPAERLAALQKAFAATLKDPEFLAEAKKRRVEIRYASPERVHATLAQIFDAPQAIKDRALEELRKAGWEGLRR